MLILFGLMIFLMFFKIESEEIVLYATKENFINIFTDMNELLAYQKVTLTLRKNGRIGFLLNMSSTKSCRV